MDARGAPKIGAGRGGSANGGRKARGPVWGQLATPPPLPVPRPFALALLAVAVLVWLYGTIDPVEYAGADLRHYIAMAEAAPGLDLERPRPFVYRPLGPWLAGILPLPVAVAFRLWTVLGALALAALLYAVCRADGRRPAAAALAVVLLAVNPYLFGFNAFDVYQTGDLLAQVALGAALWLLWRGQYAAMGAVLAVAVLAREPPVLFVPVAAVFLWERGRLRSDGVRVALALVPVVALFILPRALVSGAGGLSLGEALASEGTKALRPETWARLLVNAWVPAVAVLAVWPRETAAWARRHLHLVALFALTLASAFLGHDQERLMQPAVWAVYPAVAAVLDRHWAGRPVAVAALLVAGVLASLHHITARFPLPDRGLTVALASLAVAVALAASVAVRRTAAPPR